MMKKRLLFFAALGLLAVLAAGCSQGFLSPAPSPDGVNPAPDQSTSGMGNPQSSVPDLNSGDKGPGNHGDPDSKKAGNHGRLLGIFSLIAGGTGVVQTASQTASLSLSGKAETDGSSPIIKLKDATGSLTVGETTYNFSKVEAHIDSKKGTIDIQGKLQGTKPGEVVLRGTITGLTLDKGKVNGTFQVSLTGKLEQKGGSKNRVQLNLKGSVQLTF